MTLKNSVVFTNTRETWWSPKKDPEHHEKVNRLKKRLSQHTVGPDCRCSRFKCFQNIVEDERQVLIERFNGLAKRMSRIILHRACRCC